MGYHAVIGNILFVRHCRCPRLSESFCPAFKPILLNFGCFFMKCASVVLWATHRLKLWFWVIQAARVITVGFWSVLTIHVIPKTRIVLVPHLNGWCIRWIYYLLQRILTHLGFLKLNSVHFCHCHWQLYHHCKIFTFLSSPEPLGQFQINFAQNIINLDDAFKLFQWRATFISKGK